MDDLHALLGGDSHSQPSSSSRTEARETYLTEQATLVLRHGFTHEQYRAYVDGIRQALKAAYTRMDKPHPASLNQQYCEKPVFAKSRLMLAIEMYSDTSLTLPGGVYATANLIRHLRPAFVASLCLRVGLDGTNLPFHAWHGEKSSKAVEILSLCDPYVKSKIVFLVCRAARGGT